MRTRSENIDDFLACSGWKGARRVTLAADASFRRYERVFGEGRQAVLMDAPPEKEDIRPFIHIGEHLTGMGLSAPKIIARDIENGFLLLEDLGDDLFTRRLKSEPENEEAFYLEAGRVLAELYHRSEKADYNGIPPYDLPLLMRELSLFTEWFLPAAKCPADAQEYHAIWQALLARLPPLRPLLVLRDYHADNLLWLPQREGIQKVGLLDFQDGVVGSPAYDMVSFLEDARRDVQPSTVKAVLKAYLEETKLQKGDFMAAYALLGAQRNCKIIGIFARLAVRDGKHYYLSYLPRVWGHLAQDMTHPAMKPLAAWMEKNVPQAARGAIRLSAQANA